MSSFYGIQMISRALSAFQSAIEVTGHNVSNVNTTGYSRQRVDFRAVNPYAGASMKLAVGGGVDISGITRIRDNFVQLRLQNAMSDSTKYGVMNDQLKQIEQIFNELGDGGLSSDFDKFYTAFQQLATNPSSVDFRILARDAAANLTRSFRELDTNLYNIDQNIQTHFNDAASRVNELSSQIATLNEKIQFATGSGQPANDLMDSRDLLLEEMSTLIDVDIRPGENGAINVFSGEAVLVWNTDARELPSDYDAATNTLSDGGNPPRVRLNSGALAGYAQTRQLIDTYRDDLNTLASNFITQANLIHQAGYTTDNLTNVALFTGTNAGDIEVSTEVMADTKNIAAAGGPPPISAGDNSMAVALAGLRGEKQAALGNVSFGDYYNMLVTKVGKDSASFQSNLGTQQAVLTQVQNLRDSVSGVSLDEEMANLMKFQRSYQAAARALTIMDSLVGETIERLGA